VGTHPTAEPVIAVPGRYNQQHPEK